MIATHPLIATVESRFGGIITKGSHTPDGAACLHEALNIARGEEWSDNPGDIPDLRSLNDAPWSSDALRTKHMLAVGVAVLWPWPEWSPERRTAFARYTAEHTIRVVVPMALRAAAAVHPDEKHKSALKAAAAKCADEGTESAAWSAESAARSAESAWSAAESAESARSAAWSAESAWSAWSAAESARSAAWSAAESADAPLIAICDILVEAAAQSASVPA